MAKTCFIAMPVSTSIEYARVYQDDLHFNHVLEYLMVPAVYRANYELIRPIATGADLIHAEIIRQLETADLVLCDISTLNPNVFFELGIRTAVDQPVCIVRDARTEAIPFDRSILNIHTYDPSLAGWLLDDQVKALAEHLRASAEQSSGRNPMWAYFGLTSRAAFREGESPLEAKIDLLQLRLDSVLDAGAELQPRPRLGTPSLFRRNVTPEEDLETFKRSTAALNPTKIPIDRQVEFVGEANKIGRDAHISSISFSAGGVIIGYIGGEFTADERTELEELASRYGVQPYIYKRSTMPGD